MNIEEQLSSVLNNPEAMGKISSIIGALGGGGALSAAGQSPPPSEPSAPPPSAPPPSPSAPVLPDLSADNRTKLLMALKPFLSEKRAPYVDGAVAILRMMQLGKR